MLPLPQSAHRSGPDQGPATGTLYMFLNLYARAAIPWLAVMIAGCDSEQGIPQDANGQRVPTKVVTARLQTQHLIDQIEALGTARANESIEIKPRLPSIVTGIAFEEGQRVEKGDLLVELENSEIRAGLAVAEAVLSESLSIYNRSQSLIDTQAISAANLEQLKAAMQVNEAQVAAARARLANTFIRAPFSGRVGLRRISPGGFVDTSTVITTLDDVDPMKLDFTMPETFLAVVTEGMTIVAQSLVYPDRRFTGTVESIDTRLDPVARSVRVRAVMPNTDALLKPGMFLTVDLQRDRGEVLVAPEESIVPERGQQFVFRVEGGKAVLQEVTLGRRVPGLVEIVAGASPGDTIITEGTHKIRDGSDVEVIERQAAGDSAQDSADDR